MNQKTYRTFPYIPLEISKFRHIYDRNGAANPYNKRSEKDYMEALEKLYQFDHKPFTDDFDFMSVQNIGIDIDADYHDCLKLINSHKNKLFRIWDLSYISTFIIHDIWNGKIYTYAHPDLKIKFYYEQDKKRFPVHAECLKIWDDKSVSEYSRLKWLFDNSDHVGYVIPNPDVTGHWKDIDKMMKSLDNIPHYKVSLIRHKFDMFVENLQYKPNPNRKYRLDYSLDYFGGFGIKRME